MNKFGPGSLAMQLNFEPAIHHPAPAMSTDNLPHGKKLLAVAANALIVTSRAINFSSHH